MPGGLFCAIGNPLNDGTWTYTWQNGCQLQKMQKNGETVEFVYNENGLRVQKTATTTGATKYTLHGKNIVHMTQGNNELHFFYDAQNKPAVIVYNGTPYSYVKNLQGDIVAILDSNKNVVVSYVYDAWGRPISKTGSMATTLGTVQPFRYRGYVYDEELEFYYIATRYCSIELNRFVNEDSLICVTRDRAIGCNAYAYCDNQPVMKVDYSGCKSDWLWDAIKWVDKNIVQPVDKFIDNVIEDIEDYDKSNESEDKVFDANYFSSYKGTLVVKTSWNGSFSFGLIHLSLKHQQPDVLKHEYGHKAQLDNIGVFRYIPEVAVPSLTINLLETMGKLPYDYYSYPWEAEANELGGAMLTQSSKPSLPEDAYNSYWDLLSLFWQ